MRTCSEVTGTLLQRPRARVMMSGLIILNCLLDYYLTPFVCLETGKVHGHHPPSSRRTAQEHFSSRPPPLDYASHTRPRTPAQAQIHTHTLHPRAHSSRRLAGATIHPARAHRLGLTKLRPTRYGHARPRTHPGFPLTWRARLQPLGPRLDARGLALSLPHATQPASSHF